jgi:hypothetical protein
MRETSGDTTEIKRMQVAEREPRSQATIQGRGYDSPQLFYDDSLERIQQRWQKMPMPNK